MRELVSMTTQCELRVTQFTVSYVLVVIGLFVMMRFLQSLDMKAFLFILETFDSQVGNVDAYASRWTDELKRVQPFILQLLDNVAITSDGTNRAASVNVERCW